MHRYADLNRGKHSRLTRLEGNLVVANRKPRGKKETGKRDPQLYLWIVILIMFSVSGLYIRYQALYVEDSVFRDAYLLINEHFLSKEPLPDPNEVNTSTVSSSVPVDPSGSSEVANQFPSPVTTQNPIPPQTSPPNPQSTVTPQQVPRNPLPNSVNPANPTSPVTTSRMNTTSVAQSPSSLTPQAPQSLQGVQAQSREGGLSQEGSPYTSLPQTSVPQPGVTTINNNQGQGIPSPSSVSPQSLQSLPESSPTTVVANQSEVFSYYQPILNSKSTKVGFFVVNKKTDYIPQQLYQALFNNLLTFQSSNPKVKNFFDPKTRLNHAWVENDTLLLDFNTAFENSKYGYMGIEVKIQQILWTFFNFKADSVNKISYISFLLNGKRKDTIGGDGKTLKPFYSRKDLRSVITL